MSDEPVERPSPEDQRTASLAPEDRSLITSPTRIGSYRILAKIGEGGMGIVYRAEQENPKRQVAVKVVRGGRFVDEAAVKMFQREANSLARLKHPGIAAIYESGRTEDGRHFFAMELVEGTTLDLFLRSRGPVTSRAELRFRLQLFCRIADAVHYAHQRGVIHRDLKPNNIILSETARQDSVPSSNSTGRKLLPDAKILDFGLARITEGDLAATTLATGIGVIKGTLPYMSPEQARGNPDQIDVRTDVHALGVILYEMLSGRRPYDVGGLALVEAVRVICEEPPRPLQGSMPGSLRLDPDIETIVLKSLEKDADRRYASAAALSEDVARHLALQPILARPSSTIYQLRKFAHRHRAAVGATAALVAMLIVSVAALTVLYLRAETARRAEEKQRQAKEREADRATEAKAFLQRVLWPDDPESRQRSADIRLADVLEQAGRQVDAHPPDNRAIEAEVRDMIGMAYRFLGLYDEAERHLRQALEIYEREVGMDSDQALDVKLHRALILENRGFQKEAGELLREVYDARRARLGPVHRSTLDAAYGLSINLRLQRRMQECETVAQEALEAIRRWRGFDDPASGPFLLTLAGLAKDRGAFGEAEGHYEEALRLARRDHPEHHPELLRMQNNLANFYLGVGQAAKAEVMFRELLPVVLRRYGERHPHTLKVRNNLAQCRYEQHDPETATRIWREVREARREILGEGHPDTLQATLNLATGLMACGMDEEAEPMLHEALRRGEEERPGERVTVLLLEGLATLLLDTARPDEAERLLLDAMEIVEAESFEGDIDRAVVEGSYGRALAARGRLADAEAHLLASLRTLETRYPNDHRLVQRVLEQVVVVQERSSRPDRAAAYRRRLVSAN